MEGWIKLHRKILQSRVFNDPSVLKIWLWCLACASHTKHYFPVNTGRGQTDVLLNPGQFIFGRNAAAAKLNMKPTSVRYRMQKLKRWGNLDIQAGTHFSIVTVMNWDKYQFIAEESRQPIEQATDTQLTPNEQATDTFNKGNNGKNENINRQYEEEDLKALEEYFEQSDECQQLISDAQRMVDFEDKSENFYWIVYYIKSGRATELDFNRAGTAIQDYRTDVVAGRKQPLRDPYRYYVKCLLNEIVAA
jgi:hypothetical protein